MERAGKELLLLLDVYALVYRAFFALPPLTSAKGQPVNAVYGFERMLQKMMADEKPTHAGAAFDAGIPAERLVAMPEYKAQRPDMPSDLRPQFDGVRSVLETYGIPSVQIEGEEADDCIATLSAQASASGIQTAIVSGDLDLLQLVDPFISVFVPRKGISEMTRYDEQAVRDRFGIEPAQLPDYRGLKGDPSDNLPGVPGIGEKTATKLIAQYGSLDRLLAHASEVTPKRISDLLVQYGDQARRCRDVSTAKRTLPIHADWNDFMYRPPSRERIAEFYDKFGFRTLASRITARPETKTAVPIVEAEPEPIAADYQTIADRKELLAALRAAADEPRVAIGILPPGVGWRGPDASAILLAHEAGVARAFAAGLVLEHDDTRTEFARLLGASGPKKSVHDAKALFGWAECNGLTADGIDFDTMIGAGLVDPSLGEPSVAQAARAAGLDLDIPEADGKPQTIALFGSVGGVEASMAAVGDAIYRAAETLNARLTDAGQERLFREIELPLSRVLARMETVGFRLDAVEMDRIRDELDRLIGAATEQAYRLAGEEFNLNSPKAIGSVLFERLHLPGGVKTKTGYATGSEVLAPLALEHPIAAKILEYREVAKLKSTYVDSLPTLVDKRTNRLHTTLHQLGAATGRLSSTNPNLQNIPIRTEAGRAIRRAFLPPVPGHALLAADYSQIELRLFAHLSGDRNLIEAFAQGHDVHAFTARAVFAVADDAPLDPELRRRAKAVNFGILYGMGSFGLAQSAGISRGEAREFIAGYFGRFPSVRRYIDEAMDSARASGYVATLLGRRRYLPDLQSRNHAARAAAERMAINAPLQGSAADLIKLAMVRVADKLEASALDARMILQVHDELILDVAPEQLDRARDVVRDAMENALELDVPLVVDFKSGPTWADVE